MENVKKIIKEYNGEEWANAINDAFKKIKKNVEIDGFRKGNVPYDMFVKKYGVESLYNDAIDILLQKVYGSVIEESKTNPIIQPTVDIKEIDKDKVVFEFTIIERPEVKLGAYKELKVKKDKVSVTKEEIKEEINHLAEHLAEIVVKEDGVVEKGNTAVIDFEGFLDGKPFEGGKGENYPLEIGSNTFIPGFEDGIVGMKVGEEKDLNLTFPENYTEELKNKDVVFKVKVNTIKERVLPELSKEFYEDLGYDDVNTEEEFNKKIEESIKTRKENEAENKYIDACLEKAVKNMTVEINKEILDEEIHRMMNQIDQQLKMQGINLEQYMQFTGSTHESMHEQLEPEATKRLKERFLLEEIANVEKIEITDEEANEKAEEMAKSYGMEKDAFLTEFGGLEVVKYDMKMRKAIEIVKA